jgi:hypothetical protein
MNEEGMLKPVLIGGILLGVLSSLRYLNFPCCCCIWIIGGGVLAAYVYVREAALPVTLGRGAALGLFSGIIGTVVSAVFQAPRYLINKAGLGDQIRHNIDQMPNVSAESRQMISAMLDREGIISLIIVFTFISMIIAYCVLAMAGGMIGVALFEKRTRDPEPPPTPVDIEPPTETPSQQQPPESTE